MQWFEIPGFNTVHILNAWENGDDEIVLVGSNVVSMENIFNKTSRIRLEKVTIDMKTKKYSRSLLSGKNLEFGSVNPQYVGKKSRFGYLGINDQAMKMTGVVKIDLEAGYEVGRRLFGPGCYGGEPFFVKNTTKSDDDEDDGYLMCFVHNEQTNESKFLLMDAKSPQLDVMAVIRLPRRVPYGFHGLFLNKD
ncbi:Carotenoid oxygenase [Corchorus capsularis]|uniref:Carotenoid oxygenase n=1 Tax=Corchorus capsularis TaxID=210143 RepID=A0A1R3G0M9_COCAP|nr:Carotenoid oxygenase [Corchorus capsularis]